MAKYSPKLCRYSRAELIVLTVMYVRYQKDRKLVFKTSYRLMQVKSIAECSKGSILQYFQPSLSYHLPLRSLLISIFEWLFYTGFTECLTVCMLPNFSCLCCHLLTFCKIYFLQQTIIVSKGLDPDQNRRSVSPIWVQTVCKGYQQMTKVTTSKEIVKKSLQVKYISVSYQ